jgi:hypothetical protein
MGQYWKSRESFATALLASWIWTTGCAKDRTFADPEPDARDTSIKNGLPDGSPAANPAPIIESSDPRSDDMASAGSRPENVVVGTVCDARCPEDLPSIASPLLAERRLSLGSSLRDFAFDSVGNVFVTGSFTGVLEVAATVITPANLEATYVYVAKYASDGTLEWIQTPGTEVSRIDTTTEGLAIALDADANVYVAGRLAGNADFGGGLLPNKAGIANHSFVASYGSDGAFRWANSDAASDLAVGANPDAGAAASAAVYISSDDNNEATGIAVGDRAVFLAGTSSRFSASCGGAPAAPIDDGCFFVSAFDKNTGARVWNVGRPFIDQNDAELSSYVWVTDLIVDPSEQIYVSGRWRGRLDFGGNLQSPPQSQGEGLYENGFVASYSASGGVLRWVRSLPGDNQVTTLAADADGNIYAAGTLTAPTDFGGGLRGNATDQSGRMFVASYDNVGNYRFDIVATSGDSTSGSSASGLAVQGNAVLVLGTYSGSIQIGAQALSTPDPDPMVLMIDAPTGAIAAIRTLENAAVARTRRLRLDGDRPVIHVNSQGVFQLGATALEPLNDTTSHLLNVIN